MTRAGPVALRNLHRTGLRGEAYCRCLSDANLLHRSGEPLFGRVLTARTGQGSMWVLWSEGALTCTAGCGGVCR